MKLAELTKWLDRELDLASFADDCSNNGLQAEGAPEVNKIMFGVDGCQALFDRAAAESADFVFVHHGLSWGSNPRRLTGIDGKRFGTLFCNNISLYAAHLPLDANAEFGNNAVLCNLIGLEKREPFFVYDGVPIGFIGDLAFPAELARLAERCGKEVGCAPILHGGNGKKRVHRVAVVSGGAGSDCLIQAAAAGAELLLTGELEHVMYHPALELGVAVLALGHYASETTGPRALMRKVEKTFDVKCVFADIPTGL